MSLVDTTSMMLALNIKDTTQTSRLDLLRRQVEAAVKAYCKWPLEQDSVVEYYDGNGFPDIILRKPFVSAVSEVKLDNTGFYGNAPDGFPSSSILTSGTDYSLVQEDTIGKCGLLRRLTNALYWFPSDLVMYRHSGGLGHRRPTYWPAGYGNIKVSYTYGFPPVVAVTAASWVAGIVTFTTAAAHGFRQDMRISIYGMAPVGYNFTGRVASTPTTTSFTISLPTNPGVATAFGTADGVPEDLKLAVETSVGVIRETVKYGWPLTSESLGDYSYGLSVSRDIEFGGVRQLLGAYRDTPI